MPAVSVNEILALCLIAKVAIIPHLTQLVSQLSRLVLGQVNQERRPSEGRLRQARFARLEMKRRIPKE